MSEGIVTGVSIVYTGTFRNCPGWGQSVDKVKEEEKLAQIQWSWTVEITKGIEEFYKTIAQWKVTAESHSFLSSVSSSPGALKRITGDHPTSFRHVD